MFQKARIYSEKQSILKHRDYAFILYQTDKLWVFIAVPY